MIDRFLNTVLPDDSAKIHRYANLFVLLVVVVMISCIGAALSALFVVVLNYMASVFAAL